jgi:hypothetical protein
MCTALPLNTFRLCLLDGAFSLDGGGLRLGHDVDVGRRGRGGGDLGGDTGRGVDVGRQGPAAGAGQAARGGVEDATAVGAVPVSLVRDLLELVANGRELRVGLELTVGETVVDDEAGELGQVLETMLVMSFGVGAM